MDNSKKINDLGLLKCLLFVFLYVLLCVSINDFYFSKSKVSKIITSEEQHIIYPTNTPIIQSFYSPYKTLSGLIVYLYLDDINYNSINVVLLDDKSKSLREWTISHEYVADNNSFYLSLDGLKIEENTVYYLYAYSENSNPMGIISYGTTDNGYGSSSNEGFTWAYQMEYYAFDSKIVFLEIILLLTCFMVIVAYIKKKEKYILSVVYIVFALIYYIITPFNSLFDEDGHFLRSYEISQGHMLSEHYDTGMGKTIVPESLIMGVDNVTKSLGTGGAEFLYARQKDLLNYKISPEQIEKENPNQALYSPLSYVPQVIGLLIGNLVTDNVYVYYMIGRFFAFIINTFLVLLAIKLCPEKKYLIFFLASTPVFLAQMISYSADGNVNSLSIFFVAYVFNRINKDKLKILDKIVITVGAIILALSKVIYFPFAFLVLLLQNSLFKSKKSALVYKISTIVLAISCFIIWFFIASTYLYDFQNGRDIQPRLQMIYMITHFYRMPVIFIETVYNGLPGWIGQISGGVFGKGWLQYPSTLWFTYMVLIGRELVVNRDINSSVKQKMASKYKFVTPSILVLIIILTFSSLYVQWTVYKSNMVDGIQGRYFIPLILPLSIILSYISKSDKNTETVDVNNNTILLSKIYSILIVILLVLCGVIGTIQAYY